MTTNFHFNDKRCSASLLCFIVATLFSCQSSTDSATGPVRPEDALSTFQLEPGFKIEMIASEPLVADPVDMEIDEYGRLYIVEMHGYPLDKSGLGQIKLLVDTDADGRFDKSTLFADGLTLPFGIMRWKKGVLVADAPDVLYLEDSTGDGKADIKRTVLTGFAFSNAQMNAGNPLYGLDNWIYLTSESGGTYQIYKEDFGFLGSDIYYPGVADSPRLPLKGSGRTVRFKPDQHKLELTSGATQFGHSFDSWGHHLLGNNSNHIYHEVIAAPYLTRNPDLPVTGATQTLTDHGSKVFSITKKPERQLLTNVGIFTSACGNTNYSGGSFPTPYNDNVNFVAEPVSNIVHADILTDDGASFKASRIGDEPTREFLASTDFWFRPVNMYVGPDGALYLLDYYRQIIEHPEWMSEEAVNSGDLYNGRDMGRIYRISPTVSKSPEWIKGLHLGDFSDSTLVAELANPNRWWRKNAQRLLIDRHHEQVVQAITSMVRTSKSPMGRLHALWTLEGMDALSPELIQLALKDPVAGIRENAVRLFELHMDDYHQLESSLLSLETDPDPKVRFQLLCTLGFIDTPKSSEARNRILFRDINDKWVQIAALTSSVSHASDFLKTLLADFDQEVPAYVSMVKRLTSMMGAREEPDAIRVLIRRSLKTNPGNKYPWQGPVLEGLAEGLARRKPAIAVFPDEQNLLVHAFFEHPFPSVRDAALQILKVTGIYVEATREIAIKRAVSIASDHDLSDERRAEAIHFLALGDPASQETLLKELIKPQEHPPVQLAALQTLSLIPGTTVSEYVLSRWQSLTPEIRNVAIGTFLSSEDRVRALLDAIDSGAVQKSSISFYQSVRLMTQRNEPLRKRARLMFAKNDAKKVTADYQQALSLEGDEIKGDSVYRKNCSICHQVRGDIGHSFGPDLGTVSNWQAEGILANILSPDLSIAAGYELWNIELLDGESVQGVIASETSAAISLRSAGGVEQTINRQDIKTLTTLNISGMPSGLEKNISQQQMADLIAFLRIKK